MPKTVHRVIPTDRQIDAAIARGRKFAASDRRAAKVEYEKNQDLVTLYLDDGVRVSIPRSQLQGLQDASVSQLSKVQLVAGGTGLRWPQLNVDHYVPGLLSHVFGTRRWMSQLGRVGGSSTSKAKAAAARANGRKGGRPKRQPQPAPGNSNQRSARTVRAS
jgi:hypothetical protein